MSKGFDLEPPKAPTEKIRKQGLFGKIFNSKKKSTSELETPLAQETDIALLRDKLGIGPVSAKASQDHFTALDQSADATTDAEVKQYEKEQAELETTTENVLGEDSLDNSLEEMVSENVNISSEPMLDDAPIVAGNDSFPLEGELGEDSADLKSSIKPTSFIDPSLVDEHNSAEISEQKEDSSSFNVDDFSEDVTDFDTNKGEESLFAVEKIAQLPDAATSDFADENKELVPESTSYIGAEPVVDETKHDVPIELSAEVKETESTIGESPFAQSEFEDMATIAPLQEDNSSTFTNEPKLSPLAEDDDEILAELDSLKQSSQDVEPIVEQDNSPVEVNVIAEEEGMNPILDVASEQATSISEDVIPVVVSKPKKFKSKITKKTSKKNVKKIIKKAIKPLVAKPISKVKKIVKDDLLISEAKKEQIAKTAELATEKKFQIYLAKEEKITKDFLRREKILSKYLESEKQTFLKFTGQLAVKTDSKEILAKKEDLGKRNIKVVNIFKLTKQLERESILYEDKVRQLYEKKYDAFSKWIEQESKLLRENLASFEKDVKTKEAKLHLKQKSILDTQKEVLAKIKIKETEYKTFTKKIVLAEKKLTKKQLEYDKLISEHSNITEQLIDREVNVKAQETVLDDMRREVEKDLADKKTDIDTQVVVQQKLLDELFSSFEKTKKQNILEQTLVDEHIKEKDKLHAQINKHNAVIKQKESEIKRLDKDILSRQREVEKKEEKLSYLDKKQDRFKQEQKKSQALLESREGDVLNKINTNEKVLRTIELKRAALIALEEKIENEGFQSYLNAKLDQISPDDGVMSDEEHILSDSPQLGSKIHTLIQDCKNAIKTNDFAQAKKLYSKIRHEYVQLEIPREEKSLLYAKIRETYDDINLKMLEARSEVRSRDIA